MKPATTFLHEAASASPRLSREEEADLARRWQQHRDRGAQDRLFRSQLRAVVWCCRRYAHLHSYEEAISEGCLGLLHAIDKFDPERGTRLVTYAVPWIRQRAQEAIDLRQIHLPRREVTVIKAALRRGEADPAVISKRTRRTAEAVRPIVEQLLAPGLWLDEPFWTGEGRALDPLDVIAATESPEDAILDEDERQVRLESVRRAMVELKPRERMVLEKRFGKREPPLSEIGCEMGISRERARQLEGIALGKLREAVGCG